MAELKRMTYEGQEYVLAKPEHGRYITCIQCPFQRLHEHDRGGCPWDHPKDWAPEYHCDRGTWVPIVVFMKNQLAGE